MQDQEFPEIKNSSSVPDPVPLEMQLVIRKKKYLTLTLSGHDPACVIELFTDAVSDMFDVSITHRTQICKEDFGLQERCSFSGSVL